MATIPAAGYISNNARTVAQMKTALDDVVASLRQVPGAGQAELANTIATGSITPAGSGGTVVVDTEASAATDDLTNVVTTNYPDGSFLVLRNNNAARFVVVKHAAGGAGQIRLDRSVDYTLDDTLKWLMLQRRGTDWYEVFRGPQRLTTTTVAKSATFTVQKEDLGKTFLCTGTFTVNLIAVASAGNGFIVTFRNVSTGTITLDGNSAETINGATTLTVQPGTSVTLVTDASSWQTWSATAVQSIPYRNPIVNGHMDVWQRGTSISTIQGYTADMWYLDTANTTGVATVNRSTSLPSFASANIYYNYSLEVDVTTADAAVAAGDWASLDHRIEGYEWRHFMGKALTLSFWVYSTKTGTHCIAMHGTTVGANALVVTYTVNVSNTWEYKTVSIPSSSLTAGMSQVEGIGVIIKFMLMCGTSNQTATTDTWHNPAGGYFATSAQVNCFDSTANFFRLTGVQLNVGSVALEIPVPRFEEELRRCMRYYQKSFRYATVPAQAAGVTASFLCHAPTGGTGAFNVLVPLAVHMRDTPTISIFNPTSLNAFDRNTTDNADGTGASASGGNTNEFILTITPNASNTAGDEHRFHWTATSSL